MDDVDDSLVLSADAIWGIASVFLFALAIAGPVAFFYPTRYTWLAFGISMSMGLVLTWMSRQIRKGNGMFCLAAAWLGVVASVAVIVAIAWLWFWGVSGSRELSQAEALVPLFLVLFATAKLALKSFFGYWGWRDRPKQAGGFEVVRQTAAQDVLLKDPQAPH